MSKLDSFFNKGLKAAKCKTLLKLTIPRIKLLRNRREIQIKQMRREIAKLLETGQDATARIRVEHIVREENMMAAQEILELFCEFIAVRLPIIEAQRECPLELKEAISTVCFAAPRCADLPELLQVRILFASKYGREFVSAATELMPDCGVNRQLIELLSVRAPSPETKLKLLKEIAEEHELDWDPAASETELSKAHEDLLNGATEFIGGAKLPLPKEKTLKYEKHDEVLNSVANQVPKVSLRHNTNTASTPEADHPHVIASLHPDISHEPSNQSVTSKNTAQEPHLKREQVTEEKLVDTRKDEMPVAVVGEKNEKQFLPFVSPPSASPPSFSTKPITSLPSILRPESEAKVVDLQDVLAAAQAAAETAECAAAAARSAATIAQARISELTKKTGGKFPESSNENPFHAKTPDQSAVNEKPHFGHQQSCIESAATGKLHFDHQQSSCDRNTVSDFHDLYRANVDHQPAESHDIHSFNKLKVDHDSPRHDRFLEPGSTRMQPLRLPSLDCDSYLAYPNLFSAQNSNHGSGSQSGKNGSPPGHGY